MGNYQKLLIGVSGVSVYLQKIGLLYQKPTLRLDFITDNDTCHLIFYSTLSLCANSCRIRDFAKSRSFVVPNCRTVPLTLALAHSLFMILYVEPMPKAAEAANLPETIHIVKGV